MRVLDLVRHTMKHLARIQSSDIMRMDVPMMKMLQFGGAISIFPESITKSSRHKGSRLYL
jgi:hypothetical protein